LHTLAQAALAGGAPRPILEGRQRRWADWAPDGESLALLQFDSSGTRLEFPRGKVIRRPGGYVWDLRVAPTGDALAFCELRDGLQSAVVMVDRAGKILAQSDGWSLIVPSVELIPRGCVAWAPDGKELWFAASRPGEESGLYALTRGGKVRPLFRIPGDLALLDVSRDGRVLLTQVIQRTSIMVLAPGESEERNLSWLGTSELVDLSADGRWILFTEYAQGGSDRMSVYLRGTDGSPAVRLGDGSALALSPDGRWALTQSASDSSRMFLLPTGAGEPQELPPTSMSVYTARWLPGGKQILVTGTEPGQGFRLRLYLMTLGAKEARPFTPPGITHFIPSPDGSSVVTWGYTEGVKIYPIGGGEPRTIPGAPPVGERILQWRADGRALYAVRGFHDSGGWIDEIDIATGRRVPWKQLRLADPVGSRMRSTTMTPDARAYAYSVSSTLSTLYLAEGLR